MDITNQLSSQLEVLTEIQQDENEGFGVWDHQKLAQIRFLLVKLTRFTKTKGKRFSVTDKKLETQALKKVKIKLFRGHRDVVTSCQFCGFEEEKMLTASTDTTIKLWDFEEGKCLHTYKGGHNMHITRARASPDTQLIVSSGWDKKVNMWNTETGKVIWTGYHDSLVTCCNFSTDGRYVVSASDLDHSLKVWDTYTGELINTVNDLHSSSITSCMFNPADDRIITTSMDMTTKFFDLSSNCNTITLKDHINIVSGAAFTKDERKLATVSWDKGIFFYDISTGKYRSEGPEKLEKAHEGCISCCDFSEDGLLFVTGGYDSCLGIWDIENMVQKLKLQGHTDWINDVALKKDGKWVMTGSKDKTIRVWNIENADNIPMVIEKRKAIGLKVFKCHNCSKPFSALEGDVGKDIHLCVFCRLQQVEDRENMHRGESRATEKDI